MMINSKEVNASNSMNVYTFLQSIADCIIVIDKYDIILFSNSSVQTLTGLDKNITGLKFGNLFKLTDEAATQREIYSTRESYKQNHVNEPAEDVLLVMANQKKIPIEYTISPIVDKNDQVVARVIIFRDFSKKKLLQKQVEYAGYHDQLTGLYNRRYFEEEIKRLDTKRNLPISLIFIDANGLKIINDAFGHQIGDNFISSAAKILREVCREDEIIARAGGDEFVILLTKTDNHSAELLAKRIIENAAKHQIMGISISLSCGWDTKNCEEQSIWDILANAESIMYHNKILFSPNVRNQLIKAVQKNLHIKSPVEDAHSRSVSELCVALGQADGLNERELRELKAAGFLHDIGKVAIDTNILNRVGKIYETEWIQLQSHSEKGFRILNTSAGFYDIAEYVLTHHERWDGSGYPKRLAGDSIPKMARIIAIVDAYDAMTRSMPYKQAMTKDQAIEELRKYSGSQFDPKLVNIFINKVLACITSKVQENKHDVHVVSDNFPTKPESRDGQILQLLQKIAALLNQSLSAVQSNHYAGTPAQEKYRFGKEFNDNKNSTTNREITLERENIMLKGVVVDQALDIASLKRMLSDKS